MSSRQVSTRNQTTHPASTESLALFRKFIEDTCKPAGVDDHTIGDLKLAVDEACTNIAWYAYKDREPGSIVLKIECDPKQVTVTITDFGKPYEPHPRKRPDIEEIAAGNQEVGGFGLFLIYETMDSVDYEATEDGNHLMLVKSLDDQGSVSKEA